MASGSSFSILPGSGCRMAPRWPLQAYFEVFWALIADWLPDGLWKGILSSSGLWWQDGSHMVSGGSFSALPEALVAEWLPDGLWRLILRSSGFCLQNASRMASGGSFGAPLQSGGRMAVVLKTIAFQVPSYG